jgi:hypothetical protein
MVWHISVLRLRLMSSSHLFHCFLVSPCDPLLYVGKAASLGFDLFGGEGEGLREVRTTIGATITTQWHLATDPSPLTH